MKIFLEERGAPIFIGMLLLFFLTDATNVVVRYFEGAADFLFITDKLKMSAYSRGSVWGTITILLLYKARLRRGLLAIGLIICLMFFIGIDVNDKIHLLTWIKRFTKLTFPFLLWWFLKQLTISKPKQIINVFLLIIGLQLAAVFIPFIFNSDVFLSYNPDRFGYSGLIIAQNEATFFYLLSLVFVLHIWEIRRNVSYFIWLVFVMAGSLLLGTKAGLIVIGGVIGYLLVSNFQNHKKLVLGTTILTIVIVALVVMFSGMVDFYLTIAQEYGFWSMVTSLRSDLFMAHVPTVLNEWQWYNYLFGGVNPTTSFVEMDVIDLFLFGGIIGSVVYYWALFKTLFAFKKHNYLGWFLVGMFFFIGGIAGHFFASGVNALYMVIVCWFLQNSPLQDNQEFKHSISVAS